MALTPELAGQIFREQQKIRVRGSLNAYSVYGGAQNPSSAPFGAPSSSGEKAIRCPFMPRSHSNLQRLFVSPDLDTGATLTLGKDQSLYLAAVLRKAVGDEVVVFNGRDGAWLARLATDSKKSVTLDLVEQIATQTPASTLWYGFAPLKSERLDYVVQKAVEMGAGRSSRSSPNIRRCIGSSSSGCRPM